MTPEQIAADFHRTYERLAEPSGYKASGVPWEGLPEKDRNLMIAVVQDLVERGTILDPDLNREALELWESLDVRKSDQISGAVLIAKLYDFEQGLAQISISATDGVDWVDQIGLISAAATMSAQDPIIPSKPRDDDDD